MSGVALSLLCRVLFYSIIFFCAGKGTEVGRFHLEDKKKRFGARYEDADEKMCTDVRKRKTIQHSMQTIQIKPQPKYQLYFQCRLAIFTGAIYRESRAGKVSNSFNSFPRDATCGLGAFCRHYWLACTDSAGSESQKRNIFRGSFFFFLRSCSAQLATVYIFPRFIGGLLLRVDKCSVCFE